jgi:PAS domain S-box-containing protein
VRRFKGAWLRTVSQRVAWRYSIALIAFLISFFVRDLLNNWLIGISDRGLIIFLPAILLVAFFLGLGPAILTLLLSALAAWYFFLPPFHTFAIGINGAIVLAAFIVGSGVGIALVHWLRMAITAAQALARQREVLIETDPNGILVVDAEGRIQLVNGQLTKLFGYRHNELIGQPVETLLPERYRRGHVSLRAEFSEYPTNRPMGAGRELYGLRNDGSEFPVEIGLASFLEESRESILATVVDISARKAAEVLIAADLRDMMLLNQLSNRLVREGGDHAGNLNAIVDTAIAIMGAVKGTIRLLDPTKGVLILAAQRGFEEPFLKFFAAMPVAASAYAAAMKSGERVIIEDMRESEILAGHPAKEVLLDTGMCAVTSTPLMASTGNMLGMVSTHFARRHRPNERELHLIDLLARQTADYLERKQTDALIAADLGDMMLLNQLSNRFVRQSGDYARNLNAVVDTAIAITGADKGNLQLFDPTAGVLTIAAQRGFEEPFLKFFASVRDDASACAAAMRSGDRVIVEDVRESEIFAGQPSKEVMLDAGARAVSSTPLMASTGNLLGMISTHFANPHRPSERELHLLDLLARQTADYLERKRADEIQAILAHEIQHRSNNLLAVIQTIATRSLSGSHTLSEAKAAFEARLQALARADRQLSKSNWSGVNLSEIVWSELLPYAERTVVDGTDVILSPQHAQNFGLMLHELATNAAKYGALSNGSGKVGVYWTITGLSKNNKLQFKWQERGGPPVVAPTRHGFGTTLIKATFPDARIDYAIEGLSCEIDIPIGSN